MHITAGMIGRFARRSMEFLQASLIAFFCKWSQHQLPPTLSSHAWYDCNDIVEGEGGIFGRQGMQRRGKCFITAAAVSPCLQTSIPHTYT